MDVTPARGPLDVVVVGSSNTDLTTNVPRMPRLGETLEGSKFEMRFGGKGANQAVAAGRIGAAVLFITKLGKDSLGDSYFRHLHDSSIETDFVYRTDEAATGVAPIFVDATGENCVTIVPGANALLAPGEVESARERIKSAKVLVCQGETPIPATLTALKLAREEGLTTLLNTAPATVALAEALPTLLPHCSIVCPNETELELLTGMPVAEMEDVRAAAVKLSEMGAETVLVTLGARGALLLSPSQGVDALIPAPAVDRVVDTVGAGDAFCGALASYVARGTALENAAGKACYYASQSVQREGAQESYPAAAALRREYQLPV